LQQIDKIYLTTAEEYTLSAKQSIALRQKFNYW
jgi:hypothetical protein